MRRLTLLFLALLLLSPVAHAAQREDNGTIRGRVVDFETSEPRAGAKVTLTASRATGETLFRRTATTSDDGRYEFDELPVGEETVYTLDARFDGGTFAGGAVRIPAGTSRPPVIQTTLRVAPTTSDPTVMLVRSDNIFVVPRERGGVGVIESVTVLNDSDRAYVGRGAEMGEGSDGPVPTLGFALPAEARDGSFGIVRSDLDIPQIVETDFGFGATVAIPPGRFTVIYSYELDGTGGLYDFSRTALYPVIELSVFATPDLDVESNRLVAAGIENVGGRTYEKWTATDYLDPGDTIAINVVAAEGSGLTIVAGVAAALLFIVTMGGYVLARRRRRRVALKKASRDELLVAIAELDVRKESGELSKEDWATERDRLKRELETTPAGCGR